MIRLTSGSMRVGIVSPAKATYQLRAPSLSNCHLFPGSRGLPTHHEATPSDANHRTITAMKLRSATVLPFTWGTFLMPFQRNPTSRLIWISIVVLFLLGLIVNTRASEVDKALSSNDAQPSSAEGSWRAPSQDDGGDSKQAQETSRSHRY